MSKTNKSHVSPSMGGGPVFDDQTVRALIHSTPSLRPEPEGPWVREEGFRNVDALKHDLNKLAGDYRWRVVSESELTLPRSDIPGVFERLKMAAASLDDQLTAMPGIYRNWIAQLYGPHSEDLARFHDDRAALVRLKEHIEDVEGSLEIATGRLPKDEIFGWFCERMAEIYEKFSTDSFTHLRVKGENDPRRAFQSDGAHFAANAIMHILSENEPTAAELDTAFANIVKNKKIHSDK